MRNLFKRVWKWHEVTQLVNWVGQGLDSGRSDLEPCSAHLWDLSSLPQEITGAAPGLYRRGALTAIPREGGIPGVCLKAAYRVKAG